MTEPGHSHTGVIAWFARNPVAANLLMLVIIAVGAGSAFSIQRAMFPAFEFDLIFVTVTYPGAAPEEVEQGVVMKVEEAINDLDGIKRVESDSFESMGRLMIEPEDGVPVNKLFNDIQNRIDGIATFPEEAEEPVIQLPELLFPALTIQISGPLDERSMKALADEMRRELLTQPDISAADVVGAREYEIGVEISEQLLREYHLTLQDVADTIAASSLDLPSGSVQTRNGDIMLRTLGQAYVQQDFENIVLKTWPDGTRLLLGDIATVEDGFEDSKGFALFNGQYSLGINVFAMGKQDIIETADAAKAYVKDKQQTLPEGVSLDIWSDATYYLKERLRMMLKNLAIGALLVFITLALFLEIKLAFWVMLGIPISFLGAMAVLNTPYIDSSLNMISIFGFILVLGIVVDDAIIMGESAYTETERYGHSLDNVIRGVYRVSTPATFGVLTTIVAFTPTLFVQGVFAPFAAACGWVVILCLLFSLVESKWILPSHLAHSKPTRNALLLKVDHLQEGVNARLRRAVDGPYRRLVSRCVANRYITLAAFLSLLIMAAGLVAGGVVRTVLSPHTTGEFFSAELRMSEGSAEDRTIEAVSHIIDSLHRVDAQYRQQNNTKTGLVLFHIAFQTGFCTLFMRNFIRALPYELIEAARVEGVAEWRIYWFVVLPLMKPAIAALAVLIFTFIWNDYFWAIVLTQGIESQPVTAGITSFNSQFVAQYHMMSAGSIVAAIPPVATAKPPKIPMISPTPTSSGTTRNAASTRGTVRYFIGWVERVTSASICSVTFIVAISAAMEEVTRAAIIKPTSTGPNSRTIPIATI